MIYQTQNTHIKLPKSDFNILSNGNISCYWNSINIKLWDDIAIDIDHKDVLERQSKMFSH